MTHLSQDQTPPELPAGSDAGRGATESYLVEAFVPAGRGANAVERARAAARAMTREGVSVRCVSSILVPADEVCFLVFEAPSQEAVAEAGRRAKLAVDRIVEALAEPR